MTVEITQSEFEQIIYSATSSTAAVYEGVLPYIDVEDRGLDKFLDVMGVAAASEEPMKSAVKRLLSIRGFLAALRHLDLTLTDSGFGVVSNDHVAPASKERVDKLEESLRIAGDEALSYLIELLCKVEGWGSRPKALHDVSNPLYDIREARQLIGKDFTHQEWVETRRAIYDGWFMLSCDLGWETIEDLQTKVLCNSLTDEEAIGVQKLKQHLADYVVHRGEQMMHKLRKKIINYFDSNTDTYTLLASSPEYKARHFERYENKENSSAFFFG